MFNSVSFFANTSTQLSQISMLRASFTNRKRRLWRSVPQKLQA